MDVSGSTNIYQSSNTAQTGTAKKNLGKDDFLKLFVTQLRAQDPLKPMDSSEFTSQLAQFSSLEQLTNINTGLTNMLAYQNSMQNTMAVSLIGQKVKVSGNSVTLNGQADIRYSLPADAAKVAISIYDKSGALVKQQEVSAQTSGEHGFIWDGKDKNGAACAPGGYTFAIDAVDGAGQALSATTLTYGTVTGVSFENNVTYLSIDGTTKVTLGDIQAIGGV
jgi:flagellar basal-body rod modification protein FlgD